MQIFDVPVQAHIHHARGLQILIQLHRASAFAVQRALGEFEMIDGDVPAMVAPCLDAGFIQLWWNIEWQGAFDLNTIQRINVTVQRAFDIYALRQGQPGIHKLHRKTA